MKTFIVSVKFGLDARMTMTESVVVLAPKDSPVEDVAQKAVKLMDSRLDLGQRVFAADVL